MSTPATAKLPTGPQRGVVVKFDAERGFGFIRPESARGASGQDVFVHVRNVEGHRNLQPGQSVSYQVTKTDKGPAAIKVQPGSILSVPLWKYLIIGFGLAVILAAVVLIAGGPGLAPVALLIWIAALSVVAYFMYGYDKSQAGAGGQRVPELVLHLLSALGGSPGSFVGMQHFHHKTSKQSFQIVFWLIVAVQAVLLVWWFLFR